MAAHPLAAELRRIRRAQNMPLTAVVAPPPRHRRPLVDRAGPEPGGDQVNDRQEAPQLPKGTADTVAREMLRDPRDITGWTAADVLGLIKRLEGP
jgi:hypothetical protein